MWTQILMVAFAVICSHAQEGPEYEKPHPYQFNWAVNDPETGNDYSHSQQSDGYVTSGEYRVLLPDSRVMVVTFTSSDELGYQADVTYEGTAVYSEGPKTSRQGRQYTPPKVDKPAPTYASKDHAPEETSGYEQQPSSITNRLSNRPYTPRRRPTVRPNNYVTEAPKYRAPYRSAYSPQVNTYSESYTTSSSRYTEDAYSNRYDQPATEWEPPKYQRDGLLGYDRIVTPDTDEWANREVTVEEPQPTKSEPAFYIPEQFLAGQQGRYVSKRQPQPKKVAEMAKVEEKKKKMIKEEPKPAESRAHKKTIFPNTRPLALLEEIRHIPVSLVKTQNRRKSSRV